MGLLIIIRIPLLKWDQARGQLSPLLYNVYTDNLHDHFRATGVGSRCLDKNSPSYADDMVLFSPTVTALQALLEVLLLLKKVGSARLRESDVHPISPKTQASQYQPIDRKKRKGKRVEDYSRDRAA